MNVEILGNKDTSFWKYFYTEAKFKFIKIKKKIYLSRVLLNEVYERGLFQQLHVYFFNTLTEDVPQSGHLISQQTNQTICMRHDNGNQLIFFDQFRKPLH